MAKLGITGIALGESFKLLGIALAFIYLFILQVKNKFDLY